MEKWEETLKGKTMDALATWWKNRKFKAAAKEFLENQYLFSSTKSKEFAHETYEEEGITAYGKPVSATKYKYVHNPENIARDKQEFMELWGEVFEELYTKMGKQLVERKNWPPAPSDTESWDWH
mgnify:CR=1 FL=1